MITIPTIITLSRIFLTPFIVLSIVHQWWLYAIVLFIVAAATDFFDGFLARYLNQQSFVGACLDPIADKILIIGTLCALAVLPKPLFVIPVWFLYLVIGKECAQLIGFMVLSFYYGYQKIEPTRLSKVTTVATFSFLLSLLVGYFFKLMPCLLYGMIFFLMGTMVGVFFQYVLFGIKIIQQKGVCRE